MDEKYSISADWNPWHGCTKISAGCMHCYVYRQDEMYGSQTASSKCRKTANYDLPVKRKRDGKYKIPSGKMIYTCFTSDFLLKDADEWRQNCWRMMKERKDCIFIFFTKRIDRLEECLPSDWGDGYDNVMIGCTVENQDRADYRLPIFRKLPIKHKLIVASPLLEGIDIAHYLDESINEVSVGGESGYDARPCNFDWVLDIRRQCVEKNIPFRFHQTGANFIKDGKIYRLKRALQRPQAKKADINFLIDDTFILPTEENDEYDECQLRFDI